MIMHTYTESEETLKLRGQYSILKHVKDAANAEFVKTMTTLQSSLNVIVHEATSNDVSIDIVRALMKEAHDQLVSSEFLAVELGELAKQRNKLRDILWPKS